MSAAVVIVGTLMLSVTVGAGKIAVSVAIDPIFEEKDLYCDPEYSEER